MSIASLTWQQREAWHRQRERVVLWIAWHVPRWLAYWCFIRVAAHATTGEWGNTVPHDLDVMEALRRWDAEASSSSRHQVSEVHGAPE